MSKMNLLLYLNAYEDANYTNNPTLNNFKWDRDYTGIDISEPLTKVLYLPSMQTYELFSGSVALSSNTTTTWNLALKSGTSITYVLSHNSGTAPLFRTPVTSGADATTVVTVTKNAKLLTFTSTSGTLFSLIANGAVVGNEVRLGSVFNALNQGKFKIIALTATSFTIENELGVAESAILGVNFATMVNIYSSSGVQVDDMLEITNNFSLVSRNTYKISDVSHNYIEFTYSSSLPTELAISNNPTAFSIYRDARQFLYIESDKKLQISLNDSATPNTIQPLTLGTTTKPGMFLINSTLRKTELYNPTTETAKIFFVTAK